MFSARYAGVQLEPPRPDRNTWASDMEVRMKEIRKRILDLQAELRDVAARCNHTLPDGTSQLELHSDEDSTWTRCKSCGG